MPAQPPILPLPNSLFLPPATSQDSENFFTFLHNPQIPHFGFDGDFGVHSHDSGAIWDGTSSMISEQWGGGSAFNIDVRSFGQHDYSTAGHSAPGLASHPPSFNFSVSGTAVTVDQQPLQLPIQLVSNEVTPSVTTSPGAAPATVMVPAEVTKTSLGKRKGRSLTTKGPSESATPATEPAAKKAKKSKKNLQDTASAAPNGSRRTKRQINPPSRGPRTVVDPENPPVYGKAGWIFVPEPVGEPLASKPLNQ
ncbi:hypothetical protein M378DRAFT_11719 [Amanita muscaria Koide BX008]|uniref:Uncharacterized protein n=1 Tax=Amanita muscaria (strain Koide BX008) TaxID=946122 RepID=A0A0C2WR67_AMAMK|nr:hypothetical protein M378DRAFT_11719 [Amanita muscaria Koide BX008]